MNNSSNPILFEREVCIGGDFGINIAHRSTKFRTNGMHSHDYCELTVYTEGKKSVFVNDSLYISSGGCAFTFRPGEMHCGLHNGNAIHERFVIGLRPDCFRSIRGGDKLLRCFFERETGRNNMIILPEAETNEGFRLLFGIMEAGESSLPERDAVMLSDLIRYLGLINGHYLDNAEKKNDMMPELLRGIISFIDANISDRITVTGLAERFGISVSTFERLFYDTLETTPRKFIQKRRIEYSKLLLRSGATVTESCYMSGFGDYSHFIAYFKREVGITPFKYSRMG